MRCTKCRKELAPDAVFCQYCGKKQLKTASMLRAVKRPNGAGTVYKLSGTRSKPWAACLRKKIIGCFATKPEAMRELEKVLATGGISDKYSATLREVYEDWCKVYITNKTSKKSREEKEIAWKRLSVLGDRKMRELKTSDYQAVIISAMTMEQRRKDGTQRAPKPLSAAGKMHIKKLCSQLCQHAMKDDIIDKNYAAFLTMPEGDSVDKRPFTEKQLDILWENKFDRTVQIILTLIYTGLRINELFSISLEDAHLDDNYMIGGLKTEAGKDRYIPLCKKVLPFVRGFFKESKDIGSKYLISNLSGNMMDDGNFRERDFYPTLERLKIIGSALRDENGHLIPREITPHSTRYTFFNLARSVGSNKDLLALVMGHEDPAQSVEMYGKVTEEDKRQILDMVNAL